MSEKPPKTGLATAQQIIMTELMVAAAFGSNPKRALRKGAPQRPVKVMIGPTMPPWAIRISQVFRNTKTPRIPSQMLASVAFSCWRRAEDA